MSSAIFRRLLPIIFGLFVAADVASAQPANRGTSVDRLQELEARLGRDFDRDHAAAAAWARRHGELMREEHADGRITALVSLRDGHPHTLTTLNATAADTVSADDLWPGAAAGLALNGAGVRIHAWDGGEVRLSHVELAGAVTWADDTAPGLSSHATHVAGTMVAIGADPAARGMAFAASVDAYDFYDDTAEMAAAAAAGARLSNHSYGWIRGWYRNPSTGDWYWFGDPSISRSEDARFGFYDATSQAWDDIAYNAPFYLICKSSGNDRNDSHNGGHWYWDPALGTWVWSAQGRKADGGRSGYDSIGQQGCAKNILTVGAVEDVAGGYTSPADVVMTSFSGWGPTDDGRIKPDLVANGMSLHSPVALSDVSYSSLTGTSMSSPNVTGALALLIQHYRATHGGQDMRSATLKGLAIHTASECGTDPGPDYQFGWGLLDARAAAEHISRDQLEAHAMQELSLAQGQTIRQVWTSDGAEPVRATICWTDPAGDPVGLSLDPTDPMLVNDLDLRIIDPDGTVHEPWILDPADPSAAATRGDNARDNVEMIVIDAPVPGDYTIEITHKGVLAGGTQDVAVNFTISNAGCPPGEIEDCNGNCAPAAWIGDGTCDNGVTMHNGVAIDFSCAAHNWDDGDCETPSIFWHHRSDGRNQLWFMNGSVKMPESGDLPTISNTSWTVAGVGDFNADGGTDVLWRNQSDGRNFIWFMNARSLTPTFAENVPTLGNPAAWIAAGTDDFDGDGKTDILWHNRFNGGNLVWFMDGAAQRPESGSLPTISNIDWFIAGTGDFDGDGFADILWRNQSDGRNFIWYMNGTTRTTTFGNVTTVSNPGAWIAAATDDVDGDGMADILWHNVVNGKAYLWFMDAEVQRPESGALPTINTAWRVAGTADFDSDGSADVLWRHQSLGKNLIWFMNGTSLGPQPVFTETLSNPTVWIPAGTAD